MGVYLDGFRAVLGLDRKWCQVMPSDTAGEAVGGFCPQRTLCMC